MATQLLFLRHGETEWSLSGQHTGRTDLPLTTAGERSAVQLGDRLRGVVFAHVLTSPRRRARQTCDLAVLGITPREEWDLVEWDYGAYEGLTSAEIRKESPEWNIFHDGCPGGESVEQVGRRADRLLAKRHALDGVVALVSHAHFLRVLAMRWIGQPVALGQHFILDTGSISVLGYEHAGDQVGGILLWNARPDPIP